MDDAQRFMNDDPAVRSGSPKNGNSNNGNGNSGGNSSNGKSVNAGTKDGKG